MTAAEKIPCESCKCRWISPLAAGRCATCRAKPPRPLPVARRLYVVKDPPQTKSRSNWKRSSRARFEGESSFKTRCVYALSADEQQTALSMLLARPVRSAHLIVRRCRACPKKACRCEWLADAWLELVAPPTSCSEVALKDAVTRAVYRAEARNMRRKEAPSVPGEESPYLENLYGTGVSLGGAGRYVCDGPSLAKLDRAPF